MSTIVTRAGKGSALTFAEVDANFTNLNTDKYQSGDAASLASLTLGTALAATSGGTGQASYTAGDLLYASSATALAKLADVATGNVLLSGGVGVAPSYGKVGLTTHVTGTLPVANGGTGITSFGTGVATWLGTPSSANLAAAVTDETGTGALVFANTPTLTTPTITTSATVPLVIGGTGTTSTLTLRSTSGVGTTGADIVLQVGNNGATEALRVLNSANVGIGTNNPSFKLHVYSGNEVVTNTIGQTLIEAQSIETPSAANQRLGIFGYGSATDTLKARIAAFSSAAWSAGTSTPTYLTFSTTASGSVTAIEQMRIDASGNVGIGTATPAQKLHIQGAIRGTSDFELADSGNTVRGYLFATSGGVFYRATATLPHIWQNVGTELMRLDSSGNLGVGVTPAAWYTSFGTKSVQLGASAAIWAIDVSTGDRRLGLASNLYINSSGNFIHSQTGAATLTYQTAGAHFWYNAPSGTAGAAATITERMRLNDAGELCVATTTAAFSAANRGNVTIGGTTSILSFRANGVNAGYIYHDGTNMLFDCQTAGYLAYNTNSAERMRIQNNGFVGIGTTAPTVSNATATLLHLHQSAASTPSVTHYTNGTTGAAAADGLLTGLWVDNNALFFLYENSDIIFATNATERVRISAAGNVGIGTIAPADGLLHLNGGATTNIKFTNSTTGYTTSDGFYVGLGPSSDATAYVYQRENNPMVFATNNLERMRLSAAGNIGMGTASPQCLLHVAGQLNAVTQPTLGSYANSHFVVTQQAGLYGLNVGVSGNGDTWMQTQRFDSATAYNLQLNPMGGDVRIGETTPANLKVGGTANRATTVGTNHIDIFNGTAPAGTLANGISLYSAAGEAYVMDAAGNATLFSPHDSVTNEWIFRSKHTPTGKVLRIDVEKMLRFINDHFGLDMIQEFTEE